MTDCYATHCCYLSHIFFHVVYIPQTCGNVRRIRVPISLVPHHVYEYRIGRYLHLFIRLVIAALSERAAVMRLAESWWCFVQSNLQVYYLRFVYNLGDADSKN